MLYTQITGDPCESDMFTLKIEDHLKTLNN